MFRFASLRWFFGIGMAATFMTTAASARAQMVSWPDWVDTDCPPGSLFEGDRVTGARACAYRERTVVVPPDTPVDIVEPGDYTTSTETLPPSPGYLAEQTTVTSFLFHRDVDDATREGEGTLSGTITVETEIVAIIITNRGLNATDDTFGDATRLTYPAGEDRDSYGTDSFVIPAGRGSVDIDISTHGVSIDQFRLLVRAESIDVPDGGVPDGGDSGSGSDSSSVADSGAGPDIAFRGAGGCACGVATTGKRGPGMVTCLLGALALIRRRRR